MQRTRFEDLDVVILAAGKGVRMHSELPKVLHRVCGQSLLERVLKAAAGLGPKRIIVVVGYGKSLVRSELDALRAKSYLAGIETKVVIQNEQLGTGHAVQSVINEVDYLAKSVLILPGDIPLITTKTLEAFAQTHFHGVTSDLSLLTCNHQNPSGFGRVLRGTKGLVAAIVEEKDCNPEQLAINEVNTSIYLVSSAFLKQAIGSLNTHNAQGEFYLTDIVSYGVQKGFKVEAIKTANFTAVTGANTRYELSLLEAQRRAERNKELMEKGVTFENPLTVYIDEDIEIGADSYIGAGTRIQGKTKIHERVAIEGTSIIVDSEINAGSRIKFGCVVESSKIGLNCEVGPFAHLRPGSLLGNNVKVGNFVETKKAELRDGVKANHLSYIGDAYVGENVNIGAGTITCNYDGFHKHKTIIDKEAFIGSNSSLVAPVHIGAGAVIGAGSAITKDVPPGGLALERSQQTVIEGWAERRKLEKTKKQPSRG